MTPTLDWGPALSIVVCSIALMWQWLNVERRRLVERPQAVFRTPRPVVALWRTLAPPAGERLWGQLDDGRTVALAEPAQMGEALSQLEQAGLPRPVLRQ